MCVRSRRCLSPLIMKLSSSLRFAFGQMVTSCFHIIQAASSKFIRLMYVCMLVCLSLFLSACLSMYVCMYVRMQVCMCVYGCMRSSMSVLMCVWTSLCVCMYVWMYACRHVCMYDMYKGDMYVGVCLSVSVHKYYIPLFRLCIYIHPVSNIICVCVFV